MPTFHYKYVLLIFYNPDTYLGLDLLPPVPFGTLGNKILLSGTIKALRQVLVGLPLFLLPPSGTHSITICAIQILVNVQYV